MIQLAATSHCLRYFKLHPYICWRLRLNPYVWCFGIEVPTLSNPCALWVMEALHVNYTTWRFGRGIGFGSLLQNGTTGLWNAPDNTVMSYRYTRWTLDFIWIVAHYCVELTIGKQIYQIYGKITLDSISWGDHGFSALWFYSLPSQGKGRPGGDSVRQVVFTMYQNLSRVDFTDKAGPIQS